MYVVLPEGELAPLDRPRAGKPLPEGFRYTSDANKKWLSQDELSKVLEHVAEA
jgi:UDP-N-acetylglucosamine 4,6-dehydratase